jgi:acetolactate synthase-1/2/3 large subunit
MVRNCFLPVFQSSLAISHLHFLSKGHPTPNFMTQESDLIMCIGSRFDDRITGKMSEYIPKAKEAALKQRGGIIHVDVRISEKAKQVKPTIFVHSTAKKFLETMNHKIQARVNDFTSIQSPLNRKLKMGSWLERKSFLQESYPVNIPCFPKDINKGRNNLGEEVIERRTLMSAQSVVAELNRQLHDKGVMDDCLFSTGVGIHQMVSAQLLTWTQPRQMVTSGSLGTMGVALGFVIGCKLANGKKICIAIDGDGSFNMTFTELKTVAEEKIPIKIMILDNESQMMVEYWQRLFHEERYLAVTNTANPNYGKLADAFGIKNIYCDHQEDLPEKMSQFLFDDPHEAVLFHVKIERTPCLPLVAPGKALQDMILEDVFYEGLDACSAPS